MNPMDSDITSVLNHYVKRKSLGEIQFDKKHKDSGIKVCEHIIHHHSNKEDGKDKLRLIAQISHVSDNCETPIPSTDKLNFNENHDGIQFDCMKDQSEKSTQIKDFYLKSLSLRHVKSKSLDNSHEGNVDRCHRTEVTTIVADNDGKYERVHNTTLIHSTSGKKIEKENSFTRHATSSSSSNSRPSSYYSLPSQIHNTSLIDRPAGKKKHKLTWRRLFSSRSSPKKSPGINLKEIDDLAAREVSSLQHQVQSADPARIDGKKVSNLGFNMHMQSVPFKSFPIGGKLEPLHKNKSLTSRMPHFMTAFLNSESYLPKSSRKKAGKGNQPKNRKLIIDMDQKEQRATKVVVDVSGTGNENEKFHYQINPDDRDIIDGLDADNGTMDYFHDRSGNRQRSMSGNISFSHIDVTMSGRSRAPSCPSTVICNCQDRRIDLIVEFLRLVINSNQNKNMLNEIRRELSLFDSKQFHFQNCGMLQTQEADDLSPSNNDWRQSSRSLYSNSCSAGSDIDEQLNESFSPTLLPLIAKLEIDEELHCPMETIEYFLRATCYKHFEKGLFNIIGRQCTLHNVALLHYLIRRIVKHIGDPTNDNNKRIKTIIEYAGRFFNVNYYPQIRKIHKSMESFLISSNDNDDVD